MDFKTFFEGWREFGHFLTNLMSRFVLSLFYFTVFVPFALGAQWFTDPFRFKATTLWQPRTTSDQTLKDVTRQYTL